MRRQQASLRYWSAEGKKFDMSPGLSVYATPAAEITALQQEIEQLKQDKAELELLVETLTMPPSDATADSGLPTPNVSASFIEPVTGLYNRAFMEETLEREISRGRRHNFSLTVMMVAIDHFEILLKTWNETVSMMALQQLGRILHTSIRREDFACRATEESFLLILPHAAYKPLKLRAEQIRLKVKTGLKTPYQDEIVGMTVSIGIAGYPEHGLSVAELLGAAHLAFTEASQHSGDRVAIAIAPLVMIQ
jgi:diguanylate cyclase (GGDEF)-like protein